MNTTELIEQARLRVGTRYVLEPAKVGELCNGALIIQLAAALERAEMKIQSALDVTPLGGTIDNLRGVVDEMRYQLEQS